MSEPRLTVRHIAVIVAEHFGHSLAVLRGQGRKADVAHARQVAFYLVHHHLGKSLPQIGQYFGNRDHTTVLHGIRVVTERAQDDRVLAGRLKALGKHIVAAEAEIVAGPQADLERPPSPPVTVVMAPLPASDDPRVRRVIDAVRGYVQSRKALKDVEHTQLEFGARRQVEAEYAVLDRAWRDYAATRDRS